MIWRIAIVLANVRPSADGFSWSRSKAYDRLDRSEKIAVSYFLGMVQAQLTARGVLGYSHLVHVDALLLAEGVPLTGMRPDFVAVQLGKRRSEVYGATVEAKGRTNGFDATALAAAKTQARVIPMISGLTPRETIAAEAHFGDSSEWAAVLEDPEWEGERLQIGLEGYLMVYYETVIEAGRETDSWALGDEEFRYSIPGYPFGVRIPRRLVEAYDKTVLLSAEEREQSGLMSEACFTLSKEHQRGAGVDYISLEFSSGLDDDDKLRLFD